VYKALSNIEAEVFVVDNNSVDGSVALIEEKFPEVKLISNKTNNGFAVANNQAIRLAQGKYILLLNPDTVVQENTFSKCISFMEMNPQAGALGIKMFDGKGIFLPESKRALPTPMVAFYKLFGLAKLFPQSKKFGQYHLTYLDKNQNHEVPVLSGAYVLLRKEVLDKIGLLDETFFMYGEDIDLSYRVTQAGYKNFYFADSSIIHYKGESTKKASVNYVIVFYKAMAIFANKHFSKGNAQLFSAIINFAIFIRAAMALSSRFLKQLIFPSIDFILILTGLYLCKNVYELKFKLYPNFYSKEILDLFFPLYTSLWMLFVYLSGGYDKPLQLKKIIRGLAIGSAFILIVYSLLPSHYRFSRALILIGSFYALCVYLSSRFIYHKLKIKQFIFSNSKQNARIAIVGSAAEYERVNSILNNTNINPDLVGFVNTEEKQSDNKNFIGNFDQILEIVEIHHISEIIFCAKNISSQNIIEKMSVLVTQGLEFKIAAPESLSIIGSNSIDTAGDLYRIDINNVGKAENKRSKRIFDFTASLFLLLFFWIFIFFQKNKINFLKNIFNVLIGSYTWVGYGKATRKDLPWLRPSVLSPAKELQGQINDERINKALLNYAKDYQMEKDLKLMIKFINNLDA
jgi:GT2 family glycosyltransferase